ncbi:hypothetical protein BE15_23150, partial [Sorangium cellulosum]
MVEQNTADNEEGQPERAEPGGERAPRQAATDAAGEAAEGGAEASRTPPVRRRRAARRPRPATP